MQKTCTSCGIYGDESLFVKNRNKCKSCQKEYHKRYNVKYYELNKESIKSNSKNYRIDNKEKYQKYNQEYFQHHKENIKKKNKLNSKKIREHRRKHYNKRKSDNKFRILINMRNRMSKAIKRKYKCSNTTELISCSIEDLKSHLEQQFSEGMTWDNYGARGWHIDHIKPCAAFDLTDQEQQRECFHYTNLQPLWESENCAKGARYESD